jgi:carbon storage regulator
MDIHAGQVKLGVNAPPNVTIYREEIYEKIQQQNVAAARALLSELQAASQAWREKVEDDGGKDDH